MKLTHPASKQTIEVDTRHALRYLEQGWREKPPKPAPKKRATKKAASSDS